MKNSRNLPSKSAVAYQEWVNTETGETKVFAVIDKEVYADVNFYKVWLLDLITVMDKIGNKKLKVLNYILSNIEPSTNQFGGTIREIAKNINVSTPVVNSTIKLLLEVDFFRKIRTGTYQINPEIMVRGRANKRMNLMIKYNELGEKEVIELKDSND